MDLPSAELDETRAALAPTLEATASILPWVRPRAPRFPVELAERWQEACTALARAWSGRPDAGLRPAVFALYAVALELNDGDCLRLAESLAGAADALESSEGADSPRLFAAISATLEGLADAEGLEHPAFPERARHFAARLERDARAPREAAPRSPVLDRIFAGEAAEGIERMREALHLIPPDAYAVKLAADEIRRQAETLELDGIAALASRLAPLICSRAGEHTDLDEGAARAEVEALISQLENAVAGL